MDSRVLNVLADRVLELGPKPEENGPYRNFKLTRDADGIAWLLFDREGASANTLSADVIEELDTVLAALESQRPAGLVIRSAKKSGFIAGADVNEFRGATDPRAVETAIGRAHAVIDRLESLKVPSVAVIHGFCLGGGLEVALACQSRIAIDGARFGFPGGDARPASGPRRHRALHAAGQSDAGDDPDADRQDHRRAAGKIARAGRRAWRRSAMSAMP